MPDERYQLIDFGGGRKLESVGGRLIDRPSPAANDSRRTAPGLWRDAVSRFDSEKKSWQHRKPWPNGLAVQCGGFRMPVRPTPFGHIGIFPEQQSNWRWLQSIRAEEGDAALNLFAYTGASTMALASCGYKVAHVDAAKPNVQAVRAACDFNEWHDPSIRFLVDDAAKFAAREQRRGRTYHTIVLDPPAYGHGPSGKTWRVERDLWPLLDNCLALVDSLRFRFLVTGHSPQVTQTHVREYFFKSFRDNLRIQRDRLRIESGRSFLTDQNQRRLDTGFFVRVEYGQLQNDRMQNENA